MSAERPYFLTTPIYYVNDLPHLGHAYTTVACDVLARFMRLDGRRVKFLTGSDEHGQKVEQSARVVGIAPQEFVDRISPAWREMTRLLNISNDDFIRTTEERHVRGVQALWQELERRGEIYLGRFAGWYSVRDEAFYDESELIDGPNGPSGPKVAPTGADVEWLEEDNYFFRLSAWQDRLLAFYDAHPDAIAPRSRRNEVTSFVKSGLKDLSISRTSFSWGIPVPGDPRHVIYVWLDALANYITALGYPDVTGDGFSTFWPADLHMVGKDILRFHTVYWHAFLMAAGVEPPRRVFAHGWWTIEGQKMSKSLGNFIPPKQLVDKYGLDPLRYFLLRELPFGSDGDFSHRAVIGRLNGDLANDFGNLAQRVLAMINRNCAAAVPEPGRFAEADETLIAEAQGFLARVRPLIAEQQAFHLALEAVWRVVAEANRYVDEQAPWALRRTDPARMGTVLYVLAEVLRHLGIVMQPFVPEAAAMLLDQLAVPPGARRFADLADPLPPGRMLPAPRGIFPRFVEAEAASA
jgi:methionyl-tRNA synthetase